MSEMTRTYPLIQVRTYLQQLRTISASDMFADEGGDGGVQAQELLHGGAAGGRHAGLVHGLQVGPVNYNPITIGWPIAAALLR